MVWLCLKSEWEELGVGSNLVSAPRPCRPTRRSDDSKRADLLPIFSALKIGQRKVRQATSGICPVSAESSVHLPFLDVPMSSSSIFLIWSLADIVSRRVCGFSLSFLLFFSTNNNSVLFLSKKSFWNGKLRKFNTSSFTLRKNHINENLLTYSKT